MLILCPLPHPVLYVGEEVQLRCFGANYFFTLGFHFVLRRRVTEAEDGRVTVTEEVVNVLEDEFALNLGRVRNLTTRYLVTNVRLNDTNVLEIVCSAPLRGSFGWVNKSSRVTVRGSCFDFIVPTAKCIAKFYCTASRTQNRRFDL